MISALDIVVYVLCGLAALAALAMAYRGAKILAARGAFSKAAQKRLRLSMHPELANVPLDMRTPLLLAREMALEAEVLMKQQQRRGVPPPPGKPSPASLSSEAIRPPIGARRHSNPPAPLGSGVRRLSSTSTLDLELQRALRSLSNTPPLAGEQRRSGRKKSSSGSSHGRRGSRGERHSGGRRRTRSRHSHKDALAVAGKPPLGQRKAEAGGKKNAAAAGVGRKERRKQRLTAPVR